MIFIVYRKERDNTEFLEDVLVQQAVDVMWIKKCRAQKISDFWR